MRRFAKPSSPGLIERTEALTVIDVNSGSFTRSATARETVLWTNSEAATEIARQLRLRNIAGVIIVDFIDMDSRRDQLQVLEQFNKSLKADKARPQIAQLSELGLVELTRKRQGQNIYELFGRSCPTCGGLGHLVHLPGEVQATFSETIERNRQDYNRNEARHSESRNDYGRSEYGRSDNRSDSNRSERYDNGRSEGRNDSSRDGRNDSRNQDYADRRSRFSEPVEARTEPRDDFSFAGNDDNGPELDLLNHPSYQERGGGRRRGRQQRSREPLPKTNPRLVPIPAQPVPPPTSEPMLGMPGVIALPPLSESSESDRERRGSRRHPPRGKQEPLEVITVTMIEAEQEVYAAMGLSPLLLHGGDLKNPRLTVAAVALPGAEPMPLPSSRFSREEFTADTGRDFTRHTPQSDDSAVNLASPIPDSEVVIPSIPSIPSNGGGTPMPIRRGASPTSVPDFPVGLDEPPAPEPAADLGAELGIDLGTPAVTDAAFTDDAAEASDLSEQNSDESSGPRRRRRRSSATQDESQGGEQLSLET
jgi:ribonuclease E